MLHSIFIIVKSAQISTNFHDYLQKNDPSKYIISFEKLGIFTQMQDHSSHPIIHFLFYKIINFI